MFTIINMKKIVSASALVAAYIILSIWYFLVIDPRYHFKNLLAGDINVVMPIPYILIVIGFAALYSYFLKQNFKVVAFPVIAMAVILPLFYTLAELKFGMRAVDPFGGSRRIYDIYASGYFLALFSVFSVLGASIFRKLIKGELPGPVRGSDSVVHNIIFHLPVLVCFISVITTFILNGSVIYSCYLAGLFAIALLFEKPSVWCKKIKLFIERFAGNERLFVICVFILALLIRYFWGVRLIGITGPRYVLASDDGLSYDLMAGILAAGQLIPHDQIYSLSGFGYWYFLAAIYKIFGLHNFYAVIAVQSFLGAMVPVAAFYIGKAAFRSALVPALAGVIASFDMLLIFLSVVIGMEAFYIPLVMLALAASIYFLNGRRFGPREAFLLGCAFGTAYNARPPELLLFPFVLAIIIYGVLKKVLSAVKIARIIICLFAGFVLLASLQFCTYYILYGELRAPFPSAVGQTFDMDASNSGALHASENSMLGRMGFNIFKDFRGSLAVFARSPFTVTGLVAQGFFKRLLVLYLIPNFGVFDPVLVVNPASGYIFAFPLYCQFFGYILALAGLIAAILKKGRTIGVIILLVFLLYRSAGIAFSFVLNCRYRGVLMPIFILFFVFGIKLLYNKLKGVYVD